MEDNNSPHRRAQEQGTNKALIEFVIIGILLALTWAVSTLFEIALTKALAAVILAAFGVFVLLLMAGIT